MINKDVADLYETKKWGRGHMTFTSMFENGSVEIRLRPQGKDGGFVNALTHKMRLSKSELSGLSEESLMDKVDLEFTQAILCGQEVGP